MTRFKKVFTTAAVMAALSVAGTAAAYAADIQTPAEIVSGLTGKPLESLYAERTSGKTYGAIARENSKQQDFKVQMLQQKKALLDLKVGRGVLAQERAAEAYNALVENAAACDGTAPGAATIGRQYEAGFGNQGTKTGMGHNAKTERPGKGTMQGYQNRQ